MPTIVTIAITEEETLFMLNSIGTETEIMLFLTIKALYSLLNDDENFLTDEQMQILGERVLEGAEKINAAVNAIADEITGAMIGSEMVQ